MSGFFSCMAGWSPGRVQKKACLHTSIFFSRVVHLQQCTERQDILIIFYNRYLKMIY